MPPTTPLHVADTSGEETGGDSWVVSMEWARLVTGIMDSPAVCILSTPAPARG